MFKHFCFKKLSCCHQYIFLIACIQHSVALKFFLIFDSLSLTVLTKCFLTKKKCSAKYFHINTVKPKFRIIYDLIPVNI